jgi:hypothetical protein
MLRLVADFEIADRVPSDGSVSLANLAKGCGVQAEPLIRILRALAAFGVFTISTEGNVSHSARSRLLCSSAAGGLYHAARFWAAPGAWEAWGQLDVALNGQIPHDAAWQTSRFEYLRRHPEEARRYDEMMSHFPDNRHPAIAASYDFHDVRLIADIGGGDGTTLRHILTRYQRPSGLLFDRDDVVNAIARDKLAGGRIALAAGSFFENVPRGADIYMLTRVLHNWSDDDCVRILRVCREAMELDARLLIGEQVLEPDPTKGAAIDYLLDVQMMAMFGTARTRTEAEFARLLTDTGFVLGRVIPTASPISILEAAPA